MKRKISTLKLLIRAYKWSFVALSESETYQRMNRITWPCIIWPGSWTERHLFGHCTTTQANCPPRFVCLQRCSEMVVRVTHAVTRERGKEGCNLRRERVMDWIIGKQTDYAKVESRAIEAGREDEEVCWLNTKRSATGQTTRCLASPTSRSVWKCRSVYVCTLAHTFTTYLIWTSYNNTVRTRDFTKQDYCARLHLHWHGTKFSCRAQTDLCSEDCLAPFRPCCLFQLLKKKAVIVERVDKRTWLKCKSFFHSFVMVICC